MKIVIEIQDPVFEQIQMELAGSKEFSLVEFIRANLSTLLSCDVKAEDASNQVILPMEYFLKGVKFHALAEKRGMLLAEGAHFDHERRMQEDGATKQKGFKEAYLEILSEARGRFETVESLVEEFGDLSGIW